jgi:hypothetical protein
MDPIQAAIAASEPAPVAAVPLQVTLSTGRQVAVVVPLDMSIVEALDLVGFISQGLGPELAKRRAAASPIHIARALPQA